MDISLLYPFQSAAVDYCFRTGVQPYELRGEQPAWVYVAVRMFEHNLMRECMRNFGVLHG